MSGLQDAKDISMEGNVLKAQIQRPDHSYQWATIDLSEIVALEPYALHGFPGWKIKSVAVRDGNLIVTRTPTMSDQAIYTLTFPLNKFLDNKDGHFVLHAAELKTWAVMNFFFRHRSDGGAHFLGSLYYDKKSDTIRRSEIDLEPCLDYLVGGGIADMEFIPVKAPDSLTDRGASGLPDQGITHLDLKVELNGTVLKLNGTKPYDMVLEPYDRTFDVAPFIRRAPHGRIEWIYPDNNPMWLKSSTGGYHGARADLDWQAGIDAAKREMVETLGDHAEGSIKAWLKDTYIDGGRLIRHSRDV